MDAELTEIESFINQIPPFDLLPDSAIQQLISKIAICYVPTDESLPPSGVEENRLYIVRKGALTYFDDKEQLLGRFGEQDICTIFCYPDDDFVMKVTTDEDCLLYSITCKSFNEVISPFPEVKGFFENSAAERLKYKVSEISEEEIVANSLANTPIQQFYHSPAVTIEATASIESAAIKMTELGFSCLVIIEDGQHVGIITDKDLRRRCLAAGLDPKSSVSDIMTTNVTTMDVNNTAFDALMLMTSDKIHHLPITEFGQLSGMLTITDLMHFEGQNAVNTTAQIRKAQTVKQLAEIAKQIPKLQMRMARLGTTAEQVGKSISAITMAFTKRLIEMAEKLQGPAPVDYAWLAAGSQARQEQFAHSDQDNALIISDDMQPEHEEWFSDLANFVCDGLAACGFIYCPGDVMATNPKWRQPKSVWHRYFTQWILQPKPKALMHSSIFFDLATVHGDKSLLDDVRAKMLQVTKENSLFIAHMTKNALQLRPPLGFFRDFVLISDGENKATLDLKHNGIAPIVDLARIYALSEGISAVSTIERLKLAAGTKSLSKSSARNLIDAFQFLGLLRLTHQAKRMQKGEKANNYLHPKSLSRLEREHLKDTFKVIKTLQDSRQSVL